MAQLPYADLAALKVDDELRLRTGERGGAAQVFHPGAALRQRLVGQIQPHTGEAGGKHGLQRFHPVAGGAQRGIGLDHGIWSPSS